MARVAPHPLLFYYVQFSAVQSAYANSSQHTKRTASTDFTTCSCLPPLHLPSLAVPRVPAARMVCSWRSPGRAPVMDACGIAGGALKAGGGEAVFAAIPWAEQGDFGSKVLKPSPSGP